MKTTPGQVAATSVVSLRCENRTPLIFPKVEIEINSYTNGKSNVQNEDVKVAMLDFEKRLNSLANISFNGKGESFVEQKFLTPLLELLGYDSHKDYEIFRHGDDGSSFKLKCPPVEKGNKKTKTYNPDFIPTIRKKMFWVIEAKAAKGDEVDKNESAVQGWQYCLHPEIQAKYLLLSNGKMSKIFDIYESSYGDKDVYEPILTFTNTELVQKWTAIFNLLSPEKIREKVEHDLIKQYEKICLSSLDENYPKGVSAKISSRVNEFKSKIRKKVYRLRSEAFMQDIEKWIEILKKATDSDLLFYMERPLGPGNIEAVPAVHYVRYLSKQQMSVDNIIAHLAKDYEKQTVFRKQNTFVGLCELYNRISDGVDKQKIKSFLFNEHNLKMSAFNKAETAVLRLYKKLFMVNLFGLFQEALELKIKSLPEIIRFGNPPTAIQEIYPAVLNSHQKILPILQRYTEESYEQLTEQIEKLEVIMQQDWENTIQGIPKGQREIGGFEHYGLGDNVDGLEVIVNFNIEN